MVDAFLERSTGARRLPLPAAGGGQLLPDAEHDGFFYALLERLRHAARAEARPGACSRSARALRRRRDRGPRADLAANDDGFALDADFAFELNPRLEDAIDNGVPLYFVVEFELTRPRWYWFDERRPRNADAAPVLPCAFAPLPPFERRAAAELSHARRCAERAVAGAQLAGLARGALSPTDYEAVRMRLDMAQLPKPFQVSALTSREWNLASAWQRWP